jgi:hypothetical protein
MFFNNKYQRKPKWDNILTGFPPIPENSAQNFFLPICHKKYHKDFLWGKISRG